MKLKNKVAIVTGGSKGIGNAICLELARHGANIILQYHQSEEVARQTARQITEMGRKVHLIPADFSSMEQVSGFMNKVDELLPELSENSGFDILVNNAGIYIKGEIEQITPEQFDSIYQVNVKTPLFLIQQALDRLNTDSSIVNVSSGTATQPDPSAILYGLSKAPIDNLSKALVGKLGKKGININSIAPGPTPTDLVEDFKNPMVQKFIARKTALGRMGKEQDIARLVLFLVSEDGKWVTGQHIEANGGFGA